MKHVLTGILLLQAGCDTASIPVYVEWRGPGEAQPLLDEAGAILGHDLVQVDDKYGAIWLSIHGVAPEWCVWGDTLDAYGCKRSAWVHPHAGAVAHEIGHMMGLKHSYSPDNVMFYMTGGYDLTEKQERKINRSLGRLNACE